jgi:hypothetical protein
MLGKYPKIFLLSFRLFRATSTTTPFICHQILCQFNPKNLGKNNKLSLISKLLLQTTLQFLRQSLIILFCCYSFLLYPFFFFFLYSKIKRCFVKSCLKSLSIPLFYFYCILSRDFFCPGRAVHFLSSMQ